jgi:hypothetical protein
MERRAIFWTLQLLTKKIAMRIIEYFFIADDIIFSNGLKQPNGFYFFNANDNYKRRYFNRTLFCKALSMKFYSFDFMKRLCSKMTLATVSTTGQWNLFYC